MRTVCVYCGSSDRVAPRYFAAAEALGRALAARGLGLVYGAGRTGLMGRVADAVLAHGGTVTGVIPDHLDTPELVHAGLHELIRVPGMHQRKALMAERADAFIALPGGIGTLEELAEILTWRQLGLHAKPVGLLEVEGYWSGLRTWLAQAAAEGFIPDAGRMPLATAEDPGDLLDALGR